jgi:hypothetical protein
MQTLSDRLSFTSFFRDLLAELRLNARTLVPLMLGLAALEWFVMSERTPLQEWLTDHLQILPSSILSGMGVARDQLLLGAVLSFLSILVLTLQFWVSIAWARARFSGRRMVAADFRAPPLLKTWGWTLLGMLCVIPVVGLVGAGLFYLPLGSKLGAGYDVFWERIVQEVVIGGTVGIAMLPFLMNLPQIAVGERVRFWDGVGAGFGMLAIPAAVLIGFSMLPSGLYTWAWMTTDLPLVGAISIEFAIGFIVRILANFLLIEMSRLWRPLPFSTDASVFE